MLGTTGDAQNVMVASCGVGNKEVEKGRNASFDARLCARTAEFFELHNRDNLQDRLAFACAARHSFEDF